METLTNKLLSKEAILAIKDDEIEKIDVHPWNASVCIRVMSSRERDHLEISMIGEEGVSRKAKLKNLRARMASICLCDEDGNRLFTEKDIEELGKKSAVAMDIIVQAARKLNGITIEEEEEMVKNFETTPEEDSDSDSV